jgi:pimeloyl-ACP methyl ester carboxylesterase
VLSCLRKAAWALAALFVATTAQAHAFAPCDDTDAAPGLKGSLCAVHRVPLDPQRGAAGAEQLQLFIRKFPAAKSDKGSSQGEVWLISGGPGESGASLYPFIETLRASFVGFDLIVPDHRGTGFSSRLCPKEEAPDSPAGTALAGAEWGSCIAYLMGAPARAKHFSISNAAHDLRSLLSARASLPPKLPTDPTYPTYLYAVSYGTQLVLRALQFGPLPVQGVVLDSLVPAQGDAQWDLSRRSFVVDDVGRQVLAQCDADVACSKLLGASAALSYQRVLDQFNDGSLPASLLAELPGQDLKMFLGQLLDWPAARALIPNIIKDLEGRSDASLKAAAAIMQAAAHSFPAYAQMPLSIPLTGIISGSENNARPELTAGAVRQSHQKLLFTSPLPELLASPPWPLYAPDKSFGKVPPVLPAMLVLSGTLDPKTHLQGAQAHVAALRPNVAPNAALSWVLVEGAPHFILWTAPGCFQSQVRRFVKGSLPAQSRCVAQL